MRDPLMPINAQEDPKSGPPDGAEKQALCISVATLILSVRASTSHRATSFFLCGCDERRASSLASPSTVSDLAHPSAPRD
jgi:hypothetical protein